MPCRIIIFGMSKKFKNSIYSVLKPLKAEVIELNYGEDYELNDVSADMYLFCFDASTLSYLDFAVKFISSACAFIPVCALADADEGVVLDSEFKFAFDLALSVSRKTCSKGGFKRLSLWVSSLLRFKLRMDAARDRQNKKLYDENRYKIRLVYRDVILAVTRNKLFLVLSEDELPVPKGVLPAVSQKIDNIDDLAYAKDISEKYFVQANFSPSKIFDIVVSVSEAVSNVLKHAESGTLSIYEHSDKYFVSVADKGSGIKLADIPKSVQRGHSSKSSLGMGFSIILELMDLTYLFTNTSGTTLIMQISKDTETSADKIGGIVL